MWSTYNSYSAPAPQLQVEHSSMLPSQQDAVYDALPHPAQYNQYHMGSHMAPSGMWRSYPSAGVVSDAHALEMMQQASMRMAEDSYRPAANENTIGHHHTISASPDWSWNPYQQSSLPTPYERIQYHTPEVPQPHYFAQPHTPSPDSPTYPIYSEPESRLDSFQTSASAVPSMPRVQLRAFPCEQCDRSFSRAYDLSRHRKTHSEDKHKRHQCATCDKSFTRSDALKRHAVNSQCGVIRPVDGSNRPLV